MKSGMSKVCLICVSVLVIFGVVFAGTDYYIYQKVSANLTAKVFEQRVVLARLTATALEARLDRLVKVAQALSTDPDILKHVSSGKWQDAISQVEKLQGNLPYYDPFVDRTVLVDSSGFSHAAYPELSGDIEKDLKFRAWYVPIIAEGRPWYVTGAYKRLAVPNLNVVAIAVPLKSADKILGALILQVPTDHFLDYSRNVDVGSMGLAYFVDSNGKIIAHPKFSSQQELVDFKSVPVVQQVLRGEEGVSVSYNPMERENEVTAFKQIKKYGWSVLAEEPTRSAFEIRDSILNNIVALGAVLTLLILCALYIFHRLQISHTQDKIKK